MLNYHKTYRQSVDKFKPRKPTPTKKVSTSNSTINRSHTSSINLRLIPGENNNSNELVKSSSKRPQTKQNYDHYRKDYIHTSHSKSKSNIKLDEVKGQMKYSFKIKQDMLENQENINNMYDGPIIRLKTNYQQHPNNQQLSIRPFQDTNRCLVTDRNHTQHNQNGKGMMLDYKLIDRSKPKKTITQIKTEYKETNINQIDHQSPQFDELNLRFNQMDVNLQQKIRKDIISTKHNTQSIDKEREKEKYVKVSLTQLKKMYQKYMHYQNEVEFLEKQVNFYRKHMQKQSKNSIVMALKI